MNKIFLILLFCITMNSCNTQNKIDLNELTFNENIKDLFQNESTILEAREINTTLPFLYTNNVEVYKYGNVNFTKSNENDIVLSRVGVLLEKPTNEKIVGIIVTAENTETSNSLFEEIKKRNGMPEVLLPVPQVDENNQLLGYSAYLWCLKNNYSIILSQSYEYTDGKRTIASLMYIVSNKTKVTDPNQDELVVDRLIRTYK